MTIIASQMPSRTSRIDTSRLGDLVSPDGGHGLFKTNRASLSTFQAPEARHGAGSFTHEVAGAHEGRLPGGGLFVDAGGEGAGLGHPSEGSRIAVEGGGQLGEGLLSGGQDLRAAHDDLVRLGVGGGWIAADRLELAQGAQGGLAGLAELGFAHRLVAASAKEARRVAMTASGCSRAAAERSTEARAIALRQ